MSIETVEFAQKVGQILEVEPYISKGALAVRLEKDLKDLEGATLLALYGKSTDQTIGIIDETTRLLVWCSAVGQVINLSKVSERQPELLKCHAAMLRHLPQLGTTFDHILGLFAEGMWKEDGVLLVVEMLARSERMNEPRRVIIRDVLKHFYPAALEV